MRRTVAILASALLLASGFVAGCAWQEKICKTGEVVVEGAGGGRWCEQPKPGDRACPDDQILRRFQASGREECIPNVEPPPSA